MTNPMQPLTLGEIARWEPWTHGPPDQLLECRGAWLARALAGAHAAWRRPRGHVRLATFYRGIDALRSVPFRSPSGVDLTLDMTDSRFLHLLGCLPSEPLEVALMTRLVRPGDAVIDVGAHLGIYVAHLLGRARPGGRMWAIEPSPGNAEFLRRTFGSPADLEILQVAAGEEDGAGLLLHDGEMTAALTTTASAGTIEVQVRRLDRVVSAAAAPLVVKIDVEGHEAAVLRGARGLLVARAEVPSVPSAWLVESLANHGDRRRELVATLRELLPGVTIVGVRDGTGLVPLDRVRDDDPRTLNLLAYTAGMNERVRALGDIVVGA